MDTTLLTDVYLHTNCVIQGLETVCAIFPVRYLKLNFKLRSYPVAFYSNGEKICRIYSQS